MLVSYNWLQTYFKKTLPSPEKVSDIFTFHLAEVESMEKKGDDFILDIKILPDRAPYLLNHRNIARELSVFVDSEYIEKETNDYVVSKEVEDVQVKIIDKNVCDRYLATKIKNVRVNESPNWLVKRLESVDQRSINLIVDLANFVMLDIGEPMHAFDADKVVGGINVRYAKQGEKIVTLDNKEIVLTPDILIIADDKDPLAIAGIKGGKKAEVTNTTKDIILEAAHFDASMIRKTSQKIGIKNESSKRFENNVSATYAPHATKMFINLMQTENPDVKVSRINDQDFSDIKKKTIIVSPEFISDYLGDKYKPEYIVDILNRANIKTLVKGESLEIEVPADRPDLDIKEDIVDEIGRIVGYENIKGKLPKVTSERGPSKDLSWQNSVRNFLIEKGYSEIYTYTLKDKGRLEIANPLASDKSFLRENLGDAMEERIVGNLHFADLLGVDKVRMFEFGKIFTKDGEKTSLCIGIGYKKVTKEKRPNDEIKKIRDELFEYLKIKFNAVCMHDDSGGIIYVDEKQIGTINNKDGVMELDFDEVLSRLSAVTEEIPLNLDTADIKFKSISQYPFATRDIAVFIPGDAGKEEELLKVIKKNSDKLLVRADLFDVFTKADKTTGERKTSYAYRLVFQSHEKTLSEDELNAVMKKIYDAVKEKEGWEVR